MSKRKWIVIVIGILLGIGVFICWWLFPRLPGEIAVRQWGYEVDGVYIFKPGLFPATGHWQRITPTEVYVWSSVAWSPDFQQVAFRCSDGYIHTPVINKCWVIRPTEEGRKVCDRQVDVVKHGVCLVDREGGNFRWIAVSTTTFMWSTGVNSSSEIQWTLDGRYIIFQADYYDIETGERGRWRGDSPVQDSQKWRVDLPDLHIPKEVVARAGVPCTGSCLYEGWSGARGALSPDGRYVTWAQSYGESDPQYLVVYDIHAKRLLRLARTSNFHFDQPIWLPDP